MIGIIAEIIIGLFVVSAALVIRQNSKGCTVLSKKNYIILISILLVIFLFLLTYKIAEVPVPYNLDEAGMVYDAINIAKYHTDRYGIRFPIYFNNFGGGQSALYLYLTAVLIKLFGYSIFIVRLPAILFSLISAVVFVMTIRKEMGNNAAVFAMFLFCVLPFSIMHSRWGLDAYLFFPMLIISCSVFYHALRNQNGKCFILSGIFFGVTLYSYAISYAVIPLFFLMTMICLLATGKIDLKKLMCLIIPILFFAFPLIINILIDMGLMEEIHTRLFSITKLMDDRISEFSVNNIIRNLKFRKNNIFYILFVDDHLGLNVIPRFGTMYYVSLPIIIWGFASSIRRSIKNLKRNYFSWNEMMVLLFLSALVIALLISNHSVNRLCALYVPLFYFLTTGFIGIFKKTKAGAFFITGTLILNFLFFINFYFTEFNNDLNSNILIGSVEDITEALNFANSVNRNDETIYVLEPHQTHIYVALAMDIDPVTFNEQKVLSLYDGYVKCIGKYRFQLDAVMPECIYIFRDKNKFLFDPDDYVFDVKQFGSYTVYYPALQ